ncbi:hypothetical protein OZX60_00265 [Streptococcaceae bacterium ESL0687]|nr:hypothetical protein OZX60_00265 [Streptococcaceae bacterium ESL0687]
MKKRNPYLLLLLILSILTACSKGKNVQIESSSSISSSSEVVSNNIVSTDSTSSSDDPQKEITDKFDILPVTVRMILFANTVSSSIKNNPGIDGYTLTYAIDGQNVYINLTNQSDSFLGMTIYKLYMDDNGITPVDGVNKNQYQNQVTIQDVDVTRHLFTKEEMLDDYYTDQVSYDNAAGHVVQDMSGALKKQFEEMISPNSLGKQAESIPLITGEEANRAFDALPVETRMLLFANTVDSRVKNYKGMMGLGMVYVVDASNNVFFRISSGAGSGHPYFQLAMDDRGVTPVLGVVNQSAQSGYSFLDVTKHLFTKEELLRDYMTDKENYDTGSKRVQRDTSGTFINACQNAIDYARKNSGNN